MQFDISIAMTWLLFVAQFPIAFYWLRRAWRIILKRDFSDVALYRGESPRNPGKYAPYAAALNLLGGGAILANIVAIIFVGIEYSTWSAVAGSTLWLKIMGDFILSRHARMFPASLQS